MKKKVSAISAIMLERNLRSTTESIIEYRSAEATPPISTHNWPILDYDGASTSPRRAWQHGPTKCAARHAYTLKDTTRETTTKFWFGATKFSYPTDENYQCLAKHILLVSTCQNHVEQCANCPNDGH